MSATEAIRAARTAGVRLTADGEDLLLDAASPPPPAVIEKLSRHKAEVLKLLRPMGNGWSAADWHAFFDERAGIAEFDDGLSRSEAEDHAFACSVSEWLNRNPVTSPPERCLVPVVIVSTATIHCCRTESSQPAMHENEAMNAPAEPGLYEEEQTVLRRPAATVRTSCRAVPPRRPHRAAGVRAGVFVPDYVQHSVAANTCWQGWSTAGPSHSRT
jgi:hypothetical protein